MAARINLAVAGRDIVVPTVDGRRVPYVNLDNAASTPPLQAVVREVMGFLPWYSSIHRGAGFKSRLCTEIYEEARREITRFFGFTVPTNVAIFCKNTTEALNKLAHRWPWRPGDLIVTTMAEHHSNDLPWRPRANLIYLGLLPDGSIDLDALRSCLAAHGSRVRLVALTGASNVTGCLPGIHQAAALAHAYGAKIVVDAAQLAGHRPFSALPDDDPGHLDFLAASGHKLYAPFGQGMLIGPRAFFAEGDPEYAGGGTVSSVTLSTVLWAPPPERDEAGTPNVVGAVAMAAALRELSRVGLSEIAAHEKELTARLFDGLRRLPGITIYGPPYPEVDRLGIVSFNLACLPHGLVAAALACEAGIGVRSGCFCAHPYVRALLGLSDAEAEELLTAVPAVHDYMGMVRVSLGLYNTEGELERLFRMLERLAAEPDYYLARYEFDETDGYWWPRGWRPEYGRYFSLGRGD